jgi:Ferritin-like
VQGVEALARHDVIVELLHGAAEIEHSLLVQYLYAAYSLETNPDRLDRDAPSDAINLIRMWRDSIVTIAVQEMGHLLTIQNLLHFVGGPLNFEREDFPFKSELYPFQFALRPLNRTTLAMYIVAEMPLDPSPEIFPPEVADAVAKELQEQEDCINRVGMLYERLAEHFSKLDDRVFRPESLAFQARRLDWVETASSWCARSRRGRTRSTPSRRSDGRARVSADGTTASRTSAASSRSLVTASSRTPPRGEAGCRLAGWRRIPAPRVSCCPTTRARACGLSTPTR